MSSKAMQLSKDEVQLVEENGLQRDSGAADFGEPMLERNIWGTSCG